MSFREQTSLTVEQLSDGIRCYTVRPIVSQRLWLRVLLASICGSTALTGLLPSLLSVSALITALFMAGRAVFSVELESLLIMEGIGLQLTTRYATGHEKVRFVETSAVSEVLRTPGDAASASHLPLSLLYRQVFINEAVRLDRCIFYMACLLHGNDPSHEPRCEPRESVATCAGVTRLCACESQCRRAVQGGAAVAAAAAAHLLRHSRPADGRGGARLPLSAPHSALSIRRLVPTQESLPAKEGTGTGT